MNETSFIGDELVFSLQNHSKILKVKIVRHAMQCTSLNQFCRDAEKMLIFWAAMLFENFC